LIGDGVAGGQGAGWLAVVLDSAGRQNQSVSQVPVAPSSRRVRPL